MKRDGRSRSLYSVEIGWRGGAWCSVGCSRLFAARTGILWSVKRNGVSRLATYIVKRNSPNHQVFASDRVMPAQLVHISTLSYSGVCRSTTRTMVPELLRDDIFGRPLLLPPSCANMVDDFDRYTWRRQSDVPRTAVAQKAVGRIVGVDGFRKFALDAGRLVGVRQVCHWAELSR